MGQSLGLDGHFQVLAADERFSALRMGLYRGAGAPAYEIVVDLEDQDLELAAALADWARERGLGSRIEGTGEVSFFEPG